MGFAIGKILILSFVPARCIKSRDGRDVCFSADAEIIAVNLFRLEYNKYERKGKRDFYGFGRLRSPHFGQAIIYE